MFVETLVSEPAVERFDVRVLVRLARIDQAQGDPALMRPAQQDIRLKKRVLEHAETGHSFRRPASQIKGHAIDGVPDTIGRVVPAVA